MGRLIDADELMDVILRSKKLNSECVLEENAVDTYDNGQQETFELAIKMLDKQPTAYDVDKVAREIRRNSGNGYRDVDGDYIPPMIETKEAIEIVKQGVVSDDVCEWKGKEKEYIQNPHTKRLYSNEPSMKNIYCITCGKKIKVVE